MCGGSWRSNGGQVLDASQPCKFMFVARERGSESPSPARSEAQQPRWRADPRVMRTRRILRRVAPSGVKDAYDAKEAPGAAGGRRSNTSSISAASSRPSINQHVQAYRRPLRLERRRVPVGHAGGPRHVENRRRNDGKRAVGSQNGSIRRSVVESDGDRAGGPRAAWRPGAHHRGT